MPRVLLLLSDTGPSGAASQARLALAALPGVEWKTLTIHFRRALDWNRLGFLRDSIREFHPDVLHAIGEQATLAVSLLKSPWFRWKPFPRLVSSGCDHDPGWLIRRAIRTADAILAYTPGESERYAKFVMPERLFRIQPAVERNAACMGPKSTLDEEGTIAAVGNFDRWSGLKTAVWAFDLLKYVAPESHLLLIGDGPGRESVDHFGRALGYDDYRVRFAGFRTDVPTQLASAQLAWVTHERGGVSVILEALAARTPVIAMRTVDTAFILQDGENGLLVPAGDRAALAAKTAELLKQPDEIQRLSGNAHRDLAERFSVQALAQATLAVYDFRN